MLEEKQEDNEEWCVVYLFQWAGAGQIDEQVMHLHSYCYLSKRNLSNNINIKIIDAQGSSLVQVTSILD